MADNGWSESTKWATGIASTVVGGVLLFWLTQGGGPLTPDEKPPPERKAIVTISEFDLPFVVSGDENVVASFTISNEGDAVAQACQLQGDVSPVGDEFSIQPNGVTTIQWGVRTYALEGDVSLTAIVQCANATSPPVTRQTFVF